MGDVISAGRDLLRRRSHLTWALADQALVSGVNFLTGILLIRFLGLDEFGVFTLAWMAVLLVNSLQFAMISSPMMSIGPKQSEGEAAPYYGAVFAHQLAFGALSFVLLYAGAKVSDVFLSDWKAGHLALPLGSAALAFQMQDFLRRYFFTRNRAQTAFLNDAISYIGRLVLLVCIIQVADLDSAGALWIIGGACAVAAGFGLFSLGRAVWRRSAFVSVAKRHWYFSKWLLAATLLQWSSGNLFIVVAAGLLGATAVGALKAAQNVMGVTHILFQGLENVVPIRSAVHFRDGGARALLAYLQKVAWTGGATTVAIGLPAWVFAEFWLELLYGEELGPFAHLLRWYAVIYVFMFICLPLRIGLRTIEYTQPVFLSYVIATLATLVSIYPLVQHSGLSGVMVGMLGLQIIILTTLFTAWRKRIGSAEV